MIWTKDMVDNLATMIEHYETVSQRTQKNLFLVDKEYLVDVRTLDYYVYNNPSEVKKDFFKNVLPSYTTTSVHATYREYYGI